MSRCSNWIWSHCILIRGVLIQRAVLKIQQMFLVQLWPSRTGVIVLRPLRRKKKFGYVLKLWSTCAVLLYTRIPYYPIPCPSPLTAYFYSFRRLNLRPGKILRQQKPRWVVTPDNVFTLNWNPEHDSTLNYNPGVTRVIYFHVLYIWKDSERVLNVKKQLPRCPSGLRRPSF